MALAATKDIREQSVNTGFADRNLVEVESAVERSFVGSVNNIRVRPSELIIFTTQLSIMLDSGVVLSEALDTISEQFQSSVMKDVVADLARSVKQGDNFSISLMQYPKVFDPMFVSMVRASEVSGKMSDMLGVLTSYLDFEYQTRNKVKSALTYPVIMLIAGLGAMIMMLVFVLPKFSKIYQAKGASLPGITQFFISISEMLTSIGSLTVILTSIIFISVGLYYFLCSLRGKRLVDYVKIRTPVLGTMFIDTMVTRTTRIMATMLGTGVNLLDTIKIVRGVSDNVYFEELWDCADKRIRDGYQLSDAISLSNTVDLLDPAIIQMFRAGEKSGRLGQVSDKISVFYEKKLENSIKAVMSLIEPLMIIILGSVIGLIAIALLLPVFKVSSIIAH